MTKNILITFLAFFLSINYSSLAFAEKLSSTSSSPTEAEATDSEPEDSQAGEDPMDSEAGTEGDVEAESASSLTEETNLVYYGLKIKPSLSIQQEFIDNIFAKDFDRDEKEDHITITTLGMKLNYDRWGHAFEFDGTAINKSYNEYTEEESYEKFGTLSAIIMKDKLIELNVKGKHVDSYESRADAILPRHILLLPSRRQNHFVNKKISGGGSVNLGPAFRLDASYSFEEWDFNDIDNTFRERQIKGIDVVMTSSNGEFSNFVMEYYMKDFNYEPYNDLGDYKLHNREHTAYIGFNWDEPDYKGVARLGTTIKEFNDEAGFDLHYGDKKANGFRKDVEAVGEFSVFRRLAVVHEIDFRIARYVDEARLAPTIYAVTLGAPSTEQRYVVIDEASLAYRLFFTKNTSMDINSSYSNIQSSDVYIPGESIKRDDETISVGAGVRYKINWLTISLDHKYKSRESNVSDAHGHKTLLPDETFDYIENRTTFTIGLHL